MRYGYFDNANREYVIDRVDVPVSWTNYIGLKDMYGVFNHTAGGYLLYRSPEYHRITRFRPNGVPMDGPGHYVYLRDNESGDYWTVSWQPVGKPKEHYSCRHGLSYSKYHCDYSGIDAEQTLFVAVDDPVEIWRVTLRNDTDRVRDLSVFSYLEFSFHQIAMDNQNFQMSLYAAGSRYEDGVIEHDLYYEETGYQFFTSNFTPDGFDCLRDTFIGHYRSERNPIVVESGGCHGSFQKGGNHCGCLRKKLVLQPGEQVELIYLLGEGGIEAGKAMRRKYTSAKCAEDFARTAEIWDEKLSCLQVHTPNEGMNTELNIWNLYQSEINVMFSRFTSFIEVGGRVGLGYRDTAQDAMTIPHPNPWAWCAEAILGRGSRAMKFYNSLCPALQNDNIETRLAEPYTYCQFVSGKDHTTFGEAHHPFMTGSSGWAYYAATQYMLGIRPDYDSLTVDPCIPADWKEFSVDRRWRGAQYHIHVTNPKGVEKGVASVKLNGAEVDRIPVQQPGSVANIEVVMG